MLIIVFSIQINKNLFLNINDMGDYETTVSELEQELYTELPEEHKDRIRNFFDGEYNVKVIDDKIRFLKETIGGKKGKEGTVCLLFNQWLKTGSLKDKIYNEVLRYISVPKEELESCNLEVAVEGSKYITEKRTIFYDAPRYPQRNFMPDTTGMSQAQVDWITPMGPQTPTYRKNKEIDVRFTEISLAENETPVRTLRVKGKHKIEEGNVIKAYLFLGEMKRERHILGDLETEHYIKRPLQPIEYTSKVTIIPE